MKSKKSKKIIVFPLLVFLIGIGVLGGILYMIRNSQQEQNRTLASMNAMTYAERMKTELMQGIDVTDTLRQILVSGNGKVDKFTKVAAGMMEDSIQSIQIAPDGIVTDVYPEKENEAGKIDLFHDKERGKISRYARDNHVLILQGPFEMKQGGVGIVVRNPVYLQRKNGSQYFWGFTIVIIRVPDIFRNSVLALSDFGYQYRLSKNVFPGDDSYEVVCSSGGVIADPAAYTFVIGSSLWKLEVMPQDGWVDNRHLYAAAIGGILIILLLTGLTYALMLLNGHRKKFKRLAETDTLTGIYNRHGFDEQVKQYLKRHPETHCVGIQFDIDDFKFINDMYGHASGDLALQTLSDGMREFFSENAVLGRTGGDEFCIFLTGCTREEMREKIEQFTEMERYFDYEGEKQTFSISLGYAEYLLDADNYLKLMHCADAALYEVKLRGKRGCLAYQQGFRLEIRKQLGFALKDISENVPGAFIIYRADKTDDEILFANREMVRLTGCANMDELLGYTQGSFYNLIREEQREEVDQSIWRQIESGHSNDYVRYDLRRKDGTFLPVLDHGRIVENGHYGKVFYVLIVDWMFTKKHFLT